MTGTLLCPFYLRLVPVVHCKREEFDVYIGRPSRWGNPFSHQPETIARYRVKTRQEAIDAYRQHLWHKIRSGRIAMEDLADLDQKTLGCWCTPKACHGEVLLEFAAWARDTLATRWGSPGQPFWRPGPNHTVDCVITRREGQEILLIRRANGKDTTEGGKLALPGGFWETPAGRGEPWRPGLETAEEAAARELAEETGLKGSLIQLGLKHVGRFDTFGRDPRDNEKAWAVTDAFHFDLPDEVDHAVRGGDDAEEAMWVAVSSLDGLKLAFDHREIINQALGLPDSDPAP